jgi:GNAT superfamily N-acetyltransferase
MAIIDLTDEYLPKFFCCLGENWEDVKEAGDRKRLWFEKMKNRGLRVKLARDDSGILTGFIQYLPIEHSSIDGHGLYAIMCLAVHGPDSHIGDMQGKGIGKALLTAAEEDARSLGTKGIAAWGLDADYHMPASWFERNGYVETDKKGISKLLWKPFTDDAVPPRFFRLEVKLPKPVPGKVNVVEFVNGWCPSVNISLERAKRASAEFGDKVAYREIDTTERSAFVKWGRYDGLYIDGEDIWCGPPRPYEEIMGLLEERVSRLGAP